MNTQHILAYTLTTCMLAWYLDHMAAPATMIWTVVIAVIFLQTVVYNVITPGMLRTVGMIGVVSLGATISVWYWMFYVPVKWLFVWMCGILSMSVGFLLIGVRQKRQSRVHGLRRSA